MVDFIQELKNRRVLPAVGVYAAGCWVLVEILDRLAERYLLSPHITDAAFWGLYSLIPAVILLAWSHGKPGKDRATTAEKVGIPINVIATIGLLVTAFGGKDLGAAASAVTVANEEGVQETHYVPSESFRRRMAVFFFENVSGDPALEWLQYGLTELLVQDLQQNPFLLASSPWSNFSNGFYARMRQAGFKDGLGVPRSLMREIASDANRPYFVDGSVDQAGGQYQVTVRIWETQSLKLVDELSQTGFDLYKMVDDLSVELKQSLDVPQGGGRLAEDLPLSETYGESETAFRSYLGGLNARLFDNDIETSNAQFDAALEADPNFVLAWFLKAINFIDAGNLPASQEAITRAQELDYRLPDRDRVTLKALNYRLSGQQDKLIAFLRMQVKLRDDATSNTRLAGMLVSMGQLEEAKENYLAALEKDPLNLGIYLQLSFLERATGNREAAIEYARKYEQQKPEEVEAHLVLGDYLRDSGDMQAAESYYERAVLLENNPVAPLLRIAELSARMGDANAARDYLAQAEAAARSPLEKGQVRAAAGLLEQRLGRILAAIEQLRSQEEYLSEALPPFQVVVTTYVPMIDAYACLGELDLAREKLESARELIQPPLDKFLAFSEAMLLIEEGDLEGARAAMALGSELIEQFKLEDLKARVDGLQGEILQREGEYAASANAFRASFERIERSASVGNELNVLLPIILAHLTESLILSGDLEGAEHAMTDGFRMDPSHPMLWVAKARWQHAAGLTELARASLNYALAIWKDADPGYLEYRRARALLGEFGDSI